MRPRILLPAGLAIAAAAAILIWRMSWEDPAPVEAALPAAAEEPARPQPPALPPAPPPATPGPAPMGQAPRVEPASGRVEPTGDVVVPPAPGDWPPSAEVAAEEAPPPIPPEQPQTPEWRAQKVRRVVKLMEQRAARLEQEIAEARQGGDEAKARRQELLLGRMRQRMVELNAQAATLEDAGTPP